MHRRAEIVAAQAKEQLENLLVGLGAMFALLRLEGFCRPRLQAQSSSLMKMPRYLTEGGPSVTVPFGNNAVAGGESERSAHQYHGETRWRRRDRRCRMRCPRRSLPATTTPIERWAEELSTVAMRNVSQLPGRLWLKFSSAMSLVDQGAVADGADDDGLSGKLAGSFMIDGRARPTRCTCRTKGRRRSIRVL